MYSVVLELGRIPHRRLQGRHCVIFPEPLATDIQGHNGLIILFPRELQKVASVKDFNTVILIWTDDFYSTYEK